MPAHHEQWIDLLVNQYKLSRADASVISRSRGEVNYFEKLCASGLGSKTAANWMIGPLRSGLNELKCEMDEFPVSPGTMARAIGLVETGQVSFSAAAQQLLPALIASPGRDPHELAGELGVVLDQDDAALERVISEVIREFPLKVEAYREGKKGIVAMFMGEVVKRSRGKADPRKANGMLVKKLSA